MGVFKTYTWHFVALLPLHFATFPLMAFNGTLANKPHPQNDPTPNFPAIFHARGIRYVRIQYVDHLNQVRCRVVPVSYFLKLFDSERPGIMLPKVAFGVVVLQVAPGFRPTGEYIYVIDVSSFRPCSYAPGHAVVFGFFQEQVSVPRPSRTSFEVPNCPRTLLSRLLRSDTLKTCVEYR